MTEVVRYHTDEGFFTALLIKRGPKWLSMIIMDSAGIRIRKIRKTYHDAKRHRTFNEEDYIKPLDYPVEKAKAIFLRAAYKFNTGAVSQEVLAALQPTDEVTNGPDVSAHAATAATTPDAV